jgi:eukaryotic-like serine/threonine-protein kinase
MAVHRYVAQFAPADVEAALGGRYAVGPEIAAGGQGAVFQATRTARPDGTAANDVVALKLNFYGSQEIRVQREVAAMEDVSHPNLPRLIEHGCCDVAGRRTLYVAWELIVGQPLSVQLRHGPLLESEVLGIGRDISAAIAEIWSRGIVHGDIKPSNIMLRNCGGYMMLESNATAVLIDLGAARYSDQDSIRATLRPTRYVDRDEIPDGLKSLGTWGYFSPEQMGGALTLSCASDIFSLGVVMLQCLLGRHPTDYDQGALADGVRASGGKLAANAGLIAALDKMLSPRPTLRPNPAELSRRLRTLRQAMDAERAMS